MQNLHILPLTANLFHFVTSCESSFKELSLNLVKTSEPDAEDVRKCLEIRGLELSEISESSENTLYVCFITRHGVSRPNVDSIHIWVSTVAPFMF